MARTYHSDPALWTAFRSGSLDAFDGLFRRYYPILLRYGLKLSHDAMLVEESVQDFFVYLFEHREGLSEAGNVKAYLLRSFRRRLLAEASRQRSRNRGRVHLDDEWCTVEFSPLEIIIQREDADQERERIARILNGLAPRQREAIFLRYFEGLAVPEVAEVLGISYQATVNTLYRALKSLRRDISASRRATK